jgi:hypothetical protein
VTVTPLILDVAAPDQSDRKLIAMTSFMSFLTPPLWTSSGAGRQRLDLHHERR